MTTIHVRIRSLWQRLKHYFQNCNLFPSIPPTNDEYELQSQKISTRSFIILLTISLTILILYTSLVTVTKTVIVEKPTPDQYSDLYNKYSQTLTCPCTKISINYNKLVNVQYTLHQVCTSDFVSNDWIKYLTLSYTDLVVNYDDFRWTGTYAFQALRAFCDLMNQSISDNLDRFSTSAYISASVTPLAVFQSQINTSVAQFILSTTNSFLLSLSLIRDTTQANTLYSAAQTNYIMYLPGNESLYVTTWPRFYSSCFCAASSKCGYGSAIYDYPSTRVTFIIPGLYVGCYVIESLLRSTLQCFYDQACIDKIQAYCSLSARMNTTALNPFLSSRYSVNSTVEELVNSLMVEQWNSSITYGSYYAECGPAQCTYTHMTRNDVIYIITTLIGLIGGLMTVLKLAVPPTVSFIRRKLNASRTNNGNVQPQQGDNFFSKLKHYILKFNLFPSIPPTTNEYKLQNQKISTRLFIILLTISLTILLLYTSLVTVTKTVVVEKPSIDQYLELYDKYSQTLTCPCTKISINYNKLVNVQYSFHQVCTSDFVSDEWVNYLDSSFYSNIVWFEDFRWNGATAFRTLHVYCDLMNKSIHDSLNRFYTSTYISASVTSPQLFQSQVETSVDQFILSTRNSFLLSLSLIRNTTQSNALYSGQLTSYDLFAPNGVGSVIPRSRFYNSCPCISSATCAAESAIYDYPSHIPKFIVPNFYLGCYAIESLLQSTLQCFYNQTCINILQSTFMSHVQMNIIALDASLPSRYSESSTIQELVNSLMVEDWQSTVTYNSYYDDCGSAQCTYTYTRRNDIIYIVTTLIGLVGGLMTVLKLVVPPLVKFVRKKIGPSRPNNDDVQHQRIGNFVPRLKDYLTKYNLFPSIPPTNDQYEIQNQKISTRLFIIFLTISLTILLLYTSLVTVTKTVIVRTPSIDQYLHLYGKYPQTLTCPCRKISINYNKLVNVQYSFHQVCTSDFVTKEWINYLTLSYTFYKMNHDDFRWTGTYAFQALSSFCNIINRSIYDSLNRFYTSAYISASVTSEELFRPQVKASVDQFILSTRNSFLLSLSLIRNTTQANALLSAMETNYNLNVPNNSRSVYSWPRDYPDCNCAASPRCGKESAIYEYPNITALFTVSGFYTGCYVIESLLRSTLECFYNQTCINILQSYCLPYVQMNITALDSSRRSLYSENSTVEELVNSLMVEQWNSSITYDSYYAECQPTQCTYTLTARNDLIYIVTILIGLIGGLMTVLKLIVPRGVKLFTYYILKRRRTAPQIPNIQF